jgi:hypothetical protein
MKKLLIFLLVFFIVGCSPLSNIEIESKYDKKDCYNTIIEKIKSDFDYDPSLITFQRMRCDSGYPYLQIEAEGKIDEKDFYMHYYSASTSGGHGSSTKCMKINREKIISYAVGYRGDLPNIESNESRCKWE